MNSNGIDNLNDFETEINDNLESWDAIAHMHAQGTGAEFYRIEQWLAGESKIAPWEIEELGPVEGKSLLHLQCHIGTDTLSWAREGAIVTGLDFSKQAIIEAKRFAEILDFPDATFVVSHVKDAVSALNGEKFDILYTGRGALCWLPNLDEWASICAQLVMPGGILYLEECHPFSELIEVVGSGIDKELKIHYNMFSKKPVTFDGQGSYADKDANTGITKSHCWGHGFGEIINSLINNGFKIEMMNEREESFFEPWDDFLVNYRPNYWKFKEDIVPIPMSFTLRARREY
ncbi:MAG: class I SAM-dependent methyltransferase [Candidatus Poseidoniales archaeon]|jgi:SAM-dependent methyltransferase|tara:strand:+ start:129 stop:995 length:867 start_codon:yes stop_codon:yes gene_type:complete